MGDGMDRTLRQVWSHVVLGIAAISLAMACTSARLQQGPAGAAVQATPEPPPTVAGVPRATVATPCHGVENPLSSVVGQVDPQRAAFEHGVEFVNGSVAVDVELKPGAVEGDLAQRYGLAVSARSRSYIEGFVPVSNVCALASDGRVNRVFALRRSSPAQTAAPSTP